MFKGAMMSKLAIADAFLSMSVIVADDPEPNSNSDRRVVLRDLGMNLAEQAANFKHALGSCEFLPMESKALPCYAQLSDNLSTALRLRTPDELGTRDLAFQCHMSWPITNDAQVGLAVWSFGACGSFQTRGMARLA